jgi:flavin reductase (DIM6/NTAB) family NADH-FMN oxidoreductase RutF
MKSDDIDKQLASALGRVPSGIFVLTLSAGGTETGMLASWVQQCSFRPPRVSVGIQPSREVAKLLTPGTEFVLNILESSQTDMVAHFGKGFAPGAPAFNGVEVRREAAPAPVLAEALAYLGCQVVERVTAGDHDLFIAEVRSGQLLDEGQPMVHIRKNGMHY